MRLAARTQETGATLAKEGRLDGKTSPHIVGELKMSRASPDQLHDGIVAGGGAGSAGGDGPAPATEELHVDEDGGGKRKGRSPPSKSSSLHGIS